MLELFDYFRSTASYRVRIALNLKSIDYKSTSIHLVKDGGQQHSNEYKELNPSGLVPSLKLDDGTVLRQSLSILEYLDEAYPTPSLLPNNILDKAKVREIANIIGSDIHPINNLRVLKYLQGNLNVTDEDKKSWYENWINKGFNAIESILKNSGSNGKFCFGNTVSMADIFLIPQVYNANRFNCPMDKFPFIMAINENCLKIDAFAKATPEAVGDL